NTEEHEGEADKNSSQKVKDKRRRQNRRHECTSGLAEFMARNVARVPSPNGDRMNRILFAGNPYLWLLVVAAARCGLMTIGCTQAGGPHDVPSHRRHLGRDGAVEFCHHELCAVRVVW